MGECEHLLWAGNSDDTIVCCNCGDKVTGDEMRAKELEYPACTITHPVKRSAVACREALKARDKGGQAPRCEHGHWRFSPEGDAYCEHCRLTISLYRLAGLELFCRHVAAEGDAHPMHEIIVPPPDGWTAEQIADFKRRYESLRVSDSAKAVDIDQLSRRNTILADRLGTLTQERDELAVENSELRRKVERLERAAKVRR